MHFRRTAFFEASNSTPANGVLYRILTEGDKPSTDLSLEEDGDTKKGDNGNVLASSLHKKHGKVHKNTRVEKRSRRKVRTRNSKTNKRTSKSKKVLSEKNPASLSKKNTAKRRQNPEF